MSLLAAFLDIAAEWRTVFPQHRTWLRAVRQSLGSLVCLGRRCLTRIIWAHGGQHRSWSAEYFLHSRCQWDPQALFAPILSRGLAHCPGRLVGVAVDDTRLHKTGRCIQQAFYQRDPLSPPFHVNLVLGLRFLQASLLVPLHRRAPVGRLVEGVLGVDLARVLEGVLAETGEGDGLQEARRNHAVGVDVVPVERKAAPHDLPAPEIGAHRRISLTSATAPAMAAAATMAGLIRSVRPVGLP